MLQDKHRVSLYTNFLLLTIDENEIHTLVALLAYVNIECIPCNDSFTVAYLSVSFRKIDSLFIVAYQCNFDSLFSHLRVIMLKIMTIILPRLGVSLLHISLHLV